MGAQGPGGPSLSPNSPSRPPSPYGPFLYSSKGLRLSAIVSLVNALAVYNFSHLKPYIIFLELRSFLGPFLGHPCPWLFGTLWAP